jgi:hypothetical protein
MAEVARSCEGEKSRSEVPDVPGGILQFLDRLEALLDKVFPR